MNVYDFDETIYNGDSTIDFYLYCLKSNIKLLKYLPKQIKSILLFKLKKIDRTEMKENFFCFLKDVDIEKSVESFWKQKEESQKIKNRLFNIKKNFIANFLVIISWCAFYAVSTKEFATLNFIIELVAVILWAGFSKSFLGELKKSSKYVKILSMFSSLGISFFYIKKMSGFKNHFLNLEMSPILRNIILFTLVMPFFITVYMKIYTYILNNLKKIRKETSKIEKIAGISIFILLSIFMISTLCRSKAFYCEPMQYDAVYTSDSIFLLNFSNAWIDFDHVENDIRQPLFGVFASPFVLPFYLIAVIISYIIPLSFTFVNAVAVGMGNITLLVLSAYILASLVEKGKKRIIFLIFYISTFSPLLFTIMLEQYNAGLFWLLLLLYMVINKVKDKNLAFIASTGSLLTSGITFPLIIFERKRIKKVFKKTIELGIYSVMVMFLMNRGSIIFGIVDNVKNVMNFTGNELDVIYKLKQYTYFVLNSFISCHTSVINDTWQTAEIFDFCWIGVAILVILVISFIITPKEKINIFSFCWLSFSILLLVVVGWGNAENGLILYSLYFSWAFVVLLYNFTKNIFDIIKCSNTFYYFITIASIVMLFFNLYKINQMISFYSNLVIK